MNSRLSRAVSGDPVTIFYGFAIAAGVGAIALGLAAITAAVVAGAAIRGES